MDAITLRIATPDDAALVSQIGWETFHDTFVGEFAIPYSQVDLDTFFAQAFAPQACAVQLAAPGGRTWLAQGAGGEVLGYAQVGPVSLPHPEVGPGDGEVKRLYLRRAAFGTGLATRLWDEATGWLAQGGAPRIWLGVWEHNLRAQRFYLRHGFEKVGEHDFRVGQTLDRDFIFRRG